jgi:hypothetical protein
MQGYDELMEIKDAGIVAHFSNTGGFWNVVDALRIASFAISIVGYARILFDPVGWNLELPLPAGQIYVDFANLSEASEHYVLSCSIAIVLCLLSVMKYIRHSQAYGLLIITLTFAGPEIFRFMVRMFKIRMSKSHHLVPLSRLSGVIGSFCLARSLSESWLICISMLSSGDVFDRQSDFCRDGAHHVRQHFGGVQHAR